MVQRIAGRVIDKSRKVEKSENPKLKKDENKIRRRGFLYYMGGAGAAMFAFAKNPFKFFGSKAFEHASKIPSVKVKPNPDAVKRNG